MRAQNDDFGEWAHAQDLAGRINPLEKGRSKSTIAIGPSDSAIGRSAGQLSGDLEPMPSTRALSV
jgi:hypothetical protein